MDKSDLARIWFPELYDIIPFSTVKENSNAGIPDK